jgi:hypothetical protein
MPSIKRLFDSVKKNKTVAAPENSERPLYFEESPDESASGRLGAEVGERSIISLVYDSVLEQSPAIVPPAPEIDPPLPPVPAPKVAELTTSKPRTEDPGDGLPRWAKLSARKLRTEDPGDGLPRWVTRHLPDPTIFHRHGHAVTYHQSVAEDSNGGDVYVCGGKHSKSGQLSDDIFSCDQSRP